MWKFQLSEVDEWARAGGAEDDSENGSEKNKSSVGMYRASLEAQLLAKNSLRLVTDKTVDGNEIAKDCIAFTNATGGPLLLLGIEDG